jgi:hypothetical protein
MFNDSFSTMTTPNNPFIDDFLLCNVLSGGSVDNSDSLIFTANTDTTLTFLTITNITATFDNVNGKNMRLFIYLKRLVDTQLNHGYLCYNKLILPNEDYVLSSLKVKKDFSLYIWTSNYDERFSYIIQGERYLES